MKQSIDSKGLFSTPFSHEVHIQETRARNGLGVRNRPAVVAVGHNQAPARSPADVARIRFDDLANYERAAENARCTEDGGEKPTLGIIPTEFSGSRAKQPMPDLGELGFRHCDIKLHPFRIRLSYHCTTAMMSSGERRGGAPSHVQL